MSYLYDYAFYEIIDGFERLVAEYKSSAAYPVIGSSINLSLYVKTEQKGFEFICEVVDVRLIPRRAIESNAKEFESDEMEVHVIVVSKTTDKDGKTIHAKW